jgi:uncharacterized protein YdhG (YjbR/CyaY superfamily)
MSQATKNSAPKSAKQDKGFSAEEKAAMKERAREMKAEANKASAEKDVLDKIAEMPDADRAMAQRIHEIVKANAPSLTAKTWYGQPAYANKDGKIICFFQSSHKFGTRYATLGFNEDAQLDDGNMWATAYALKGLDAAEEKKITEILKKAVG